MRILHFSDLHIGVENYGRPATDQDLESLPEHFAPGEDRATYRGLSTRMIDFLAAFDELIAYAIGYKVDLVLFSGDAYKNREPTQTHQREFAKRVARLSHANVPVFLLVGNHDLPNASFKATALEIFGILTADNITVADRLDVYRVQTAKGPIQVLALPWIRRSGFMARDDVKNLPYEKINALLEERLTEGLQDRAAGLDPRIPAIVCAHVHLNTAKIGTERSMTVGYDHRIFQSAMTCLPVDYIALGHIHRPQKLSENPPMAYPGSLQRIDFGEEDHDDKGFYVIDIDPKAEQGSRLVKMDFQSVTARAFVTIEARIPDEDPDPTATVIREIDRNYVSDAVVRVKITLPSSRDSLLRDRDIRARLEEHRAHTIAAITRHVERPEGRLLPGVDYDTKSPRDMLRLYLEQEQISGARQKTLVTYGERLMNEPPTDEP